MSLDFATYTLSKVEGEPNNITKDRYIGSGLNDPKLGHNFQIVHFPEEIDGRVRYTRTSTVVELEELESGLKWKLKTRNGSTYIVEKEQA